MDKWFRQSKGILTIITLVAFCLTCASCETLRKKFTRQKKKDQMENTDFNPVLEPQEYPAPEYNAVENYKLHYALVKVWHKDLVSGVSERDAESKISYALKQIKAQCAAMAQLLSKEKQPEFDQLLGFLSFYEESLKSPGTPLNKGRIQSDLRAFERKLSHDLRVDKVKKDLVKLEPSH